MRIANHVKQLSRKAPDAGAAGKETQWVELIPDHEWAIYKDALKAVRATGLEFLLGGGFAMSTYTHRWRETKDIDFYILPQDRDSMVEVLTGAGFEDYYRQLPYDRGWIYRSTRDGIIVDVIWAMANRRAAVDELWFKRAPTALLRDETFRVLPLEELIWAKLYVLQGDRCDWPDVINLLYAGGPELDWEHLLWRLEGDVPVFRAVMTLFSWVSPNRALDIPGDVLERLQLPKPIRVSPEEEKRRQNLLDTRAWFAASLPGHAPLEV